MKLDRRAPAALALGLIAVALGGCGGGGTSSSASGSNCTPAHQVQTLSKGQLQVNVYVSAPYTKLDKAGGDLGGVDGEIVKRIAKMECLQLKATPTDPAALIASITSKRADVAIGGIYRTADRAKVLNLSRTMYRDGMATISKNGLNSVPEMQGKSVGVIQGYLWNKSLQQVLGSNHVKLYQDSTSMLQDLQQGRLDVGVLTSAEAAYRASGSTGLQAAEIKPDPRIPTSTSPGQVVLASTKGNDSLTKAFNADIKKLVDNGSIAQILKSQGMNPSLAGGGS